MNPTAELLRRYNVWRRSGGPEMPDPREIGEAIDRAIEMIEQRDRLLTAVTAAREIVRSVRDSLIESETNPRTGEVDADLDEFLVDYDLALAALCAAMEEPTPAAASAPTSTARCGSVARAWVRK